MGNGWLQEGRKLVACTSSGPLRARHGSVAGAGRGNPPPPLLLSARAANQARPASRCPPSPPRRTRPPPGHPHPAPSPPAPSAAAGWCRPVRPAWWRQCSTQSSFCCPPCGQSAPGAAAPPVGGGGRRRGPGVGGGVRGQGAPFNAGTPRTGMERVASAALPRLLQESRWQPGRPAQRERSSHPPRRVRRGSAAVQWPPGAWPRRQLQRAQEGAGGVVRRERQL